jgi:chorismate mutase
VRESRLLRSRFLSAVIDTKAEPTLDDLRAEIARIDHALVRLVAARLRAARRAIRLRTATGETVTHRTQELVVLDRARRWAEEAAVSPELMVGVVRRLVEAGKEWAETEAIGLRPLPPQVSCRLSAATRDPGRYDRPLILGPAPVRPAKSPSLRL